MELKTQFINEGVQFLKTIFTFKVKKLYLFIFLRYDDDEFDDNATTARSGRSTTRSKKSGHNGQHRVDMTPPDKLLKKAVKRIGRLRENEQVCSGILTMMESGSFSAIKPDLIF